MYFTTYHFYSDTDPTKTFTFRAREGRVSLTAPKSGSVRLILQGRPTNGNGEIRRRCARRVVPTCPRRHTLLSKRKKTPQRVSNFGLIAQNANSLLKRLLGPKAVHVSVSKEESTRSLRIVCRFRLEQQASCTFACCATQSKLTSF